MGKPARFVTDATGLTTSKREKKAKKEEKRLKKEAEEARIAAEEEKRKVAESTPFASQGVASRIAAEKAILQSRRGGQGGSAAKSRSASTLG